MTSQLEPEEIEAIADALVDPTSIKPAADVAERDFRIPRRLSLEVVKKIESTLRNSVPSLRRSIQRVMPAELELEPTSVREITALGLFEDISEPFVVARFTSHGAPGWVAWQPSHASACVQAALGMPEVDPEDFDPEAEFSFVERRLMARLLSNLVEPIAGRFGIEVGDLFITEKIDDIGSWEDEGQDADAHRLCIELSMTAVGQTSELTLYLPGFLPNQAELEGLSAIEAPPPHLSDVPVTMRALFDTVEIPLNQLLNIEEGDILPLGPTRSSNMTLNIGQEAVARAQLGRHYERLAVRVIEFIDTTSEG